MALSGGFGGMDVGTGIPATALAVVSQFTKPTRFLPSSENLNSIEDIFTPMVGIVNV